MSYVSDCCGTLYHRVGELVRDKDGLLRSKFIRFDCDSCHRECQPKEDIRENVMNKKKLIDYLDAMLMRAINDIQEEMDAGNHEEWSREYQILTDDACEINEAHQQITQIVEQHFLAVELVGEQAEDKELINKIEKLMFDWDKGNFTVCPNCSVDDFTHVEGCKFENDNIITRLAKLLSQARPQQEKPSEWDGKKRSKSAEARWLEIPYSAYKIAYDRGYDEAQPKKVTRGQVETLAERLVNLAFIIVEQSGDTLRFLKACRFLEDMLSELGVEVEGE